MLGINQAQLEATIESGCSGGTLERLQDVMLGHKRLFHNVDSHINCGAAMMVMKTGRYRDTQGCVNAYKTVHGFVVKVKFH